MKAGVTIFCINRGKYINRESGEVRYILIGVDASGLGNIYIYYKYIYIYIVVVVVVVVSHIQRIGCEPEKNYFARWPIPLVVC